MHSEVWVPRAARQRDHSFPRRGQSLAPQSLTFRSIATAHAARQAARRRRWYLRGARRDLEVQTGIDANDALTRAGVTAVVMRTKNRRKSVKMVNFTDLRILRGQRRSGGRVPRKPGNRLTAGYPSTPLPPLTTTRPTTHVTQPHARTRCGEARPDTYTPPPPQITGLRHSW